MARACGISVVEAAAAQADASATGVGASAGAETLTSVDSLATKNATGCWSARHPYSQMAVLRCAFHIAFHSPAAAAHPKSSNTQQKPS